MLRDKGMALPDNGALHNSEQPSESTPQGRLTSIGDAYTLAATNEAISSELEDLMVRHFIETLAEVALAIASREAGKEGES